jgi:hypothetical protein
MHWKKRRAESLEGEEIRVHLLREVEIYLRRSNIAPTRFGRIAMGDPRFVFDLRNGREPCPNTVSRIREYLERVQ